MKLPDTSVWIEHLRGGEQVLKTLLHSEDLLLHPFVIGELALGHLPHRSDTIARLRLQMQAPIIAPDDVLAFIEEHELAASGLGYVDVQLLTSVSSMQNAKLWTRDKRLGAVATRLSLAAEL